MILDSSVIVSIVDEEDDRHELFAKIDRAPIVGIGAPTLVEVGIVLGGRLGDRAPTAIERVVADMHAEVIAFDIDHWREAVAAWHRFGRGRHRARLNFGDCLAYATARVAGEPLLAKGGDFALTDIELA